MRRTRNYRWPLGLRTTAAIYIVLGVPTLWYGIRGYFWLIAALGRFVYVNFGWGQP